MLLRSDDMTNIIKLVESGKITETTGKTFLRYILDDDND